VMFHSRGFYTTSRRLRLCNKQGRGVRGSIWVVERITRASDARHYRNPIKCNTVRFSTLRRAPFVHVYTCAYVSVDRMCTAVAINRSNKRRQWRAIRSASIPESSSERRTSRAEIARTSGKRTESEGNAEMMTRRNDFVDCDRHESAVGCGSRNRANANYAANNYRSRGRGRARPV